MTEDNGKKLTLSGKSTLTLKKTNMTLKPEGKKVVQVEVRKKRFVNPQTQSKPAVEIDETLAQKLELLAKAKEHEAKRKQEEEEKALLRQKQKEEALKKQQEEAEKEAREKAAAEKAAAERNEKMPLQPLIFPKVITNPIIPSIKKMIMMRMTRMMTTTPKKVKSLRRQKAENR